MIDFHFRPNDRLNLKICFSFLSAQNSQNNIGIKGIKAIEPELKTEIVFIARSNFQLSE